MKIDSDLIKKYLTKAMQNEVCIKHPLGVVIETDKRYILGWNGPPIGTTNHKCLRAGMPSGEGMELCPTIHAEIKAIANAKGYKKDLVGATIYMPEWFPCYDCAENIVEAGLAKLVTPDELYANGKDGKLVEKLRNQSYNFEKAEETIRKAGIEIIIEPRIKLS